MEVVPLTVGKEGGEWELELPFEGKEEGDHVEDGEEEELGVVPLVVGKEGEEWEVERVFEVE